MSATNGQSGVMAMCNVHYAAHVLCRLLHIFGSLNASSETKDKRGKKLIRMAMWSQLLKYIGYVICHHPTLFYCIDSILVDKQKKEETTAKTLKFMICYFSYCCTFSQDTTFFFSFFLLCIVWIKRQNYIELVTSLFCHIFCIIFIVLLQCWNNDHLTRLVPFVCFCSSGLNLIKRAISYPLNLTCLRNFSSR